MHILKKSVKIRIRSDGLIALIGSEKRNRECCVFSRYRWDYRAIMLSKNTQITDVELVNMNWQQYVLNWGSSRPIYDKIRHN